MLVHCRQTESLHCVNFIILHRLYNIEIAGFKIKDNCKIAGFQILVKC